METFRISTSSAAHSVTVIFYRIPYNIALYQSQKQQVIT
jgi:hypothetical protein